MFGMEYYGCCGFGLESNKKILKPTLVTALEMTPCQQVMTGVDFMVALTRSGELYLWGYNGYGQLGHGHTHNESRPGEVILQSDDGAPDPMVQVSTSIIFSTSCFLSRGLS
jgi:alpha-tubulin suppressor-like RCC1 family protein